MNASSGRRNTSSGGRDASAGELPAYLQRGDGDTAVVMLHGVGGGKEAWPGQVDALAAAGYRAVAWDMPGYGGSIPVDPYTMEQLARSLARLLTALQSRRTVLIGHSMGGMVAQELLALGLYAIDGLVLSATSPAFGRPDGAWQQEFLRQRLAPLEAGGDMGSLAARLLPAMIGTGADEAGVRIASEIMSAVPAATYRAALHALMGFDRRAALPAIGVPALLIAGERDTTAPPEVMRRMAERIPHGRYVCLEGAGHLANLEQPAAFNGALLDFLHERFPL